MMISDCNWVIDRDADDRLSAIHYAPPVSNRKRRPYLRSCVNCGKAFLTPPSAKTRTCSADCSTRHRSRKHLGKSNLWENTVAAQAAAERTGNLLHGTSAARMSRNAGPFETNVSAKVWVLIDPARNRHTARNLRLWCETNASMFDPHDWRSAYAGIRQVAAWLRGKRRRPVTAWRGWSIADLPQPNRNR